MKLLIMALVLSLSALADTNKTCSVELNFRSNAGKLDKSEVVQIAANITRNSNIELANGDVDYSIEVRTIDYHDPHSNRIMPEVIFSAWPASIERKRSERVDNFSKNYIRPWRITKKLFKKLVKKSLSKYLKGCDSLKSFIQAEGNGTLDRDQVDGFLTSTGSVFVKRDIYWEAPSGLLWGQTLKGKFDHLGDNSNAKRACKNIGARLPSTQEYKELMSYYQQSSNVNRALSKKGFYEFNSMFPYSYGMFWTATIESDFGAFDFHHEVGSAGSAGQRRWELLVRCVK